VRLHYRAILLGNDDWSPLTPFSATIGCTLLRSNVPSKLRKHGLLLPWLASKLPPKSRCTYGNEVVLPVTFAVIVVLRNDLVGFMYALATPQPIQGDFLVTVTERISCTILFIVRGLGASPTPPIETREASGVRRLDAHAFARILLIAGIR
jgi:hypothetical protein